MMNPFTLLNPYINGIKIAAAILIIAGIFAAGFKAAAIYYEGIANEKQVILDKLAQAQFQRNMDMRAKYNAIILKAENENANNKITIGKLGDFIDSVQPSGKIICSSPMRMPTSTKPSSDRGSGVASTRVDGYIAISPRDRARIIATYKRCAQLNIDAIRINASLIAPK